MATADSAQVASAAERTRKVFITGFLFCVQVNCEYVLSSCSQIGVAEVGSHRAPLKSSALSWHELYAQKLWAAMRWFVGLIEVFRKNLAWFMGGDLWRPCVRSRLEKCFNSLKLF